MTKFKSIIEDVKHWVINHKTMAIALPIVLVLSSFFVIENIKDYQSIDQNQNDSNGFNTSLPSENTKTATLEEEALWKQSSKKENNPNSNAKRSPELIDREQKEDSIKQVLKELENISFDLEENKPVSTNKTSLQKRDELENKKGQGGKLDETLEARLNYRELLREGKEKMLEANNTAPPSLLAEHESNKSNSLKVRVKVYRDQFVLPDDRVQLILAEELNYKGAIIPRNTFFYALTSVKGNRVLLDANNINHTPINAVLKDFRDGMDGIYSERAGDLWGEYGRIPKLSGHTSNESTQ